MAQSPALTCPDCGYVWRPRKSVTRYPRQCPHCKHVHSNQAANTGKTQAISQAKVATATPPITGAPQWPKVAYDLMGISNASSPENALQRAFELYRRLLPYKFKYNLSNLEETFEFLEKKAADATRKAEESSKLLQEIKKDPRLLFYETVGADLAAVKWYNAHVNAGYRKDFLTFLSEMVEKCFEQQAYVLVSRENRD